MLRKLIVVVMEVICGHIVGHGAVNLPPIDLKPLQVDYWSHYLSFDMSLNMGNAIFRLIFKNFIFFIDRYIVFQKKYFFLLGARYFIFKLTLL